MKSGADRGLLERVRNLEEEVEEQRLLLRRALNRFDGEALEPDEKESLQEKIEVPATRSWQTVGGNRVPDVSSRTPTGRTADGDASGQESFRSLAALFRLRGWEWWLNKVGIGLLLFGVVFLFKFSVDRGWLVPEARVGFGLALGAGLVWFGLRVYEERRAFSQVMLGGGVGTFYITGFAAFQLHALVPYALAFVFLVAVTLLAFALSVRQDEAALALIGVAGGFGTPFLLYEGSGELGGLVLYTALVLAGIAAVYAYKGWRSLILVSAVGVFGALFAGYSQAAGPLLEGGRAGLQAGVLFAALVLWLVPVAREVLRRRQPARWPAPKPGRPARSFFSGTGRTLHPGLLAHLLSAVVPLVGLFFTQEIWGLSKEPLGWVAAGVAVAYAAVAGTLRRVEGGGTLYYTNVLAALGLFTLGLCLVLEGNALFFALAAEAAVLHLVSRRYSDKTVSALANGLFFTVGVWLAGRIFIGIEETFYFGPGSPALPGVGALLDLLVVALSFGLSAVFTSERVARVYRVAAHAALLGLLFRELVGLPGGDTLAFLSWAVYASALHLLSRRYPPWGTVAGAHAVWGVLGLWLSGRLAWGFLGWEQMAVFDFPAVADLGAICLALLSSFLLPDSKNAVFYRLVVHAAVLTWLWRELAAFPDGAAYVTVSWSVYAAGLLVLGLRRATPGLVRLGIFTLFLVVGKLFLVDLVWVDAVWRILLFLGAGGLFLTLSYYLQALWKTETGSHRRFS